MYLTRREKLVDILPIYFPFFSTRYRRPGWTDDDDNATGCNHRHKFNNWNDIFKKTRTSVCDLFGENLFGTLYRLFCNAVYMVSRWKPRRTRNFQIRFLWCKPTYIVWSFVTQYVWISESVHAHTNQNIYSLQTMWAFLLSPAAFIILLFVQPLWDNECEAPTRSDNGPKHGELSLTINHHFVTTIPRRSSSHTQQIGKLIDRHINQFQRVCKSSQ